jgi:hypothetical protein
MADIKITPTALQGKLSAKLSSAELTIQQAQVTRTPPQLSNLPRPVTLRGEVQAQSNDGTVRIQTPRGVVEVKLQTPLPQGQKVDIQLSSGTPPREVIVQSAPPKVQSQPQSSPPQPQSSNTPAASASQSQGTVKAPQQTPQGQQPTIPQTQNQAQVTPSSHQPINNQSIETVKNLQTTAKQAIETLAQGANLSKTSAPNQTVQGNQIQGGTQQIIQVGQAIRLTPLPSNLQNPTALAQLPLVSTPNATPTILPPIQGASLLNLNIVNAPTGTQANIMSMPVSSLTQSPQPAITNLGALVSPTQNATALPQTTLTALPTSPALSAQAGQRASQPLLNTALLSTPSAPVSQDARVLNISNPGLATSPQVPNNGNVGRNFLVTAVSPAISNLQPGQVMLQATGHMTVDGNPIVQTIPQGGGTPLLMALHYPAKNLSAGTVLVLQPTGQGVSQVNMAQSWPLMMEAFEELLAQLSPSQTQSLFNVIPRPAAAGHQFTATALLFIAAARGGEISGWMGARADQILRGFEGGKKDMLNRLLSDIGRLTARTAASDPSAPSATQGGGDWRGYTLPLLFGMDLTKINLWTKPFGKEENEGSEAEKMRGTRFIVDLELSRMGNVQLDGLVQPYAKRLDLALRTEHAFSSDIRQHLRERWQTALHTIDMSGQIDFQTT